MKTTIAVLLALVLALGVGAAQADGPAGATGTLTLTTTVDGQPMDLSGYTYPSVPTGVPITFTFTASGQLGKWYDCTLVDGLDAVTILGQPEGVVKLSPWSHWYDVPNDAREVTWTVQLDHYVDTGTVFLVMCLAEDLHGRAAYDSGGFSLRAPTAQAMPYRALLPHLVVQ